MNKDELYSPAELAKELKVSAQSVHRWIRDGKLKAIRLPGGTYRISGKEIERAVATVGGNFPPPADC